MVGKDNLWITNVKLGGKRFAKLGKVFKKSVKDLNLDWKEVCVLDPDADKTLNGKEAKKFKYFVFGGILGDYPPRKRTEKELTRFLPKAKKRNIGKEQMATDNAVYVVLQIAKGKEFEKMEFKDGTEIEMREGESVILPFRYVLVDGKPMISKEIVSYLKRKKGF